MSNTKSNSNSISSSIRRMIKASLIKLKAKQSPMTVNQFKLRKKKVWKTRMKMTRTKMKIKSLKKAVIHQMNKKLRRTKTSKLT